MTVTSEVHHTSYHFTSCHITGMNSSKPLNEQVHGNTSQQELASIKAKLADLPEDELRALRFVGNMSAPEVPRRQTHPDDVWDVGHQPRKDITKGPHLTKNSWRKWKADPSAVRSLLQQPMEKPADMPALLWEHFQDEYTRVATTPRERRQHMSTLLMSAPKDRGFVLDGVAASRGNGMERRFKY